MHNYHGFAHHDVYHHDSYYSNEATADNSASNHLMSAYYVEPDSVVIHEDSIHCNLHLHEHEYFSNALEYRAAHLDLHVALFQ